MGFLGFTLLLMPLWPLILIMSLISSVLEGGGMFSPAEIIDMIIHLPEVYAFTIIGIFRVIFEYLPSQFGLPNIVEIISKLF